MERPANTTHPPPPRGLRRDQRVRSCREFEEAYGQGSSWRGRLMVLWLRSGPGAALRLGVVASRKVGGSVQRARAKRRLREVYRLNRHQLAGDCDVILVARYSLPEAPWPAVVEDLLTLARRAGILRLDAGRGAGPG